MSEAKHEPRLSEATRAAVLAHRGRFADRRAAVLPALHEINTELGHVPRWAVGQLAGWLDLHPAEVEDTVSFYSFFKRDRAAVGAVRIWVCRSIVCAASCAALGGEPLLEYLCEKLGIEPGQTTEDGRITVEAAECLGACDVAPAMLVGETLYGNLTCEKVDRLLDELRETRSGED